MVNVDRRWCVLADGWLTTRNAKTAHGVIKYGRDPVVAVLDREHAGATLDKVLPTMGSSAPVVASLEEAIELGANSLLLGVATPGGWIPDEWRGWLTEALRDGFEIANGLHRFLRDEPELVKLAEEQGGTLWDVRAVPHDIPLSSGKALDAPQRIVGTVGSDCAVGKMTAALELVEAAAAGGVTAEFIATGQTGILIAGRGIAVDRVISDFISGAAERLILEADPASEVLLVEGQGGLWHPSYSGVTLGLLHGSAPEALVLVHQAGREAIEEPPYTRLPPLAEMIQTYEQLASAVRPCKVAAIAVNCRGLGDEASRAAIADIEDEAGLPAADVWRGGAPVLWQAVSTTLGPR
ncbi:MAG: DUF1611 domain-containing protein [Actinomycetota bacterium]